MDALSAKERWMLILSAIGARLALDDQLRAGLERPMREPQWGQLLPTEDGPKGEPQIVYPKTILAQFFEQWLGSGAQIPPNAERLAQIAKDVWNVTDTDFEAFESEGTSQSEFIKKNIAFFFDGEDSASKWAQKTVQKLNSAPKRAERAAAEQLQQEKNALAAGNRVYGVYESAAFQDREAPDWALRKHELVSQQYDTKARDADLSVRAGAQLDLAALYALKTAFESKNGAEMIAAIQPSMSGKKAKDAREALGGLSTALPGSKGRNFQSNRRHETHEIFAYTQKASPAERGVWNFAGQTSVWLDQEVADWLLKEARETEKIAPLANAELVRLTFCAPNLAPAFVSHVASRLRSPLTENKGRLSSEMDEPQFDELFPGWDRGQGAPSVMGELSAAQMAKQTKKQEEAVWAQAREEGPLGEIAVSAAQIYGLSAVDGPSLIGEAKKTLMQEAGWTNGVWRLAANNPDFAKISAQALAEQIKSSSNRLRDHDIAQRKRDLRDLLNSGWRPMVSSQEKLELLEARKKSGIEMERWFVEKKAELEASSIARALMSIGQTAIMRGGLDESFLNFSRFVSEPPLVATHQVLQAKAWTSKLLAGAASNLSDGAEAAIMQALNDQKACQELAPQWAAAFAEGLSRAKKAAKKELDDTRPGREGNQRDQQRNAYERFLFQQRNAQADRLLLAHERGQNSFINEPPPSKDEYANILAQERFATQLGQLRDCVVALPGFMQALPKKFNWGFLMNAQEGWHAQLREIDFAEQATSHLKWASVSTDFKDGQFEAVTLKNSRDLFDEGKIMSHCVFSYADRCAGGSTRIVSIQRGGRRVATLELFPLNAKGQSVKLDSDGENAHEVASWKRGQNNGPHNGKIDDPAILAFCDQYEAHLIEHAKKLKESRRASAALANESLAELSGMAPMPRGVANKTEKANEAKNKAPIRRVRAGGL